MLTIVAYDITNPKRLRKVANCCKDFGIRVQYSIFECHLEADRFEELWRRLADIADPDEDRLIAYPIMGAARHRVRTFGLPLDGSRVISYIF